MACVKSTRSKSQHENSTNIPLPEKIIKNVIIIKSIKDTINMQYKTDTQTFLLSVHQCRKKSSSTMQVTNQVLNKSSTNKIGT